MTNTMEPPHVSMMPFERQDKTPFPYYHYAKDSRAKTKRRLKILIVSGSQIEQNRLATMLKNQKHFIYQATDKDSLLEILRTKKCFDVVIVSNHFKVIGFAFFTNYFRASLGKRKPCLIHLGEGARIPHYDGRLTHPFTLEDLEQLILK